MVTKLLGRLCTTLVRRPCPLGDDGGLATERISVTAFAGILPERTGTDDSDTRSDS